jgi:Adenosine deaminase
MRHLARWRMHLATVALGEGARVGELAGRLGYESEAAFSRAYKRIVGVPPTAAGAVESSHRARERRPSGLKTLRRDPAAPFPA